MYDMQSYMTNLILPLSIMTFDSIVFILGRILPSQNDCEENRERTSENKGMHIVPSLCFMYLPP